MIGRVIDGRYRIQSLIAIGGMGRVYKAEQTSLGRTVAIKILSVSPSRQAHDPLFRERFALEAATASRLTSPNTITIFHYGRSDDDIYYIVMEYVEGITLGRLLKRDGRLSIPRAITIASQVCLSLREAHARGIVHRDIKPSNVMLVNGDYDQVKVLDFGIAKQMVRDADEMDQELTSSRSYIGTPEYMAPEYFDGRVDSRSDIYAVGVMLYVAVTGRLPFKGKTATQTILMALHDPAPDIDPALGLPRGLEQLIFSCLEKDPELRPPSTDDVIQALQYCLAEAENAGYGSEVLTEADMVDPAPHVEDPLTATQPFVLGSQSSVARVALPSRNRLAKGVFAAAALLSIGVAAALIVRISMGEPDVGAPAPSTTAAQPAEPVPEAAMPATPAPSTPATPPSVAPAAAAVPAGGRAAAAAPARATQEAEPPAAARRIRRPVERARPARAAAPPAEPARGEREPTAARKPKPDDAVPVPEGYKPSPY